MNTDQIESIRRLNIHPGETLVVRVGTHTDKTTMAEVRRTVQDLLPEGVNVLVTTSDVELDVVAKPRRLPMRHTAYTDQQWADLEEWCTSLGLPINEVCDITLTDHTCTVTAYKTNSDGRRYAVGDEIATTRRTVPLEDTPAWFTELAAWQRPQNTASR